MAAGGIGRSSLRSPPASCDASSSTTLVRTATRNAAEEPFELPSRRWRSPARSAPPTSLRLDEALEQLRQHDPRKSTVVELRYFGGLTVDEIAGHLNVSPITVK